VRRVSLAAVAALAGVVAVLAVACDGSRGPGALPRSPDLPPPPNQQQLRPLKGEIIIDGSSTVFPVTQAAAEEFRRYAPDVRISVGISGTGGGFKKFCAGETDVQDASRPIRDTEIEACAQRGIEFIEVPVAFDGIAVVASPRNAFLTCLTTPELKTLWRPEAQGKVTRWKQVRASFPDQPIKLFGPGTDSGTFDYFTDAINQKEKASRGDFQASEDDNVLVQGVANDPTALGYFGFAYYAENVGKLKLLAVDGGHGCVEPSFETIANSTYQPLSRPLFIYVRRTAAERAEVRAFVEFYLSKSFTPVISTREVGYVQLADPIYVALTKRFRAMRTGTLWPQGIEIGATLDRYLQ